MTIDDEPQYPNRKNESHPNGKEKEGKRRTFLGMQIGGGKDKDKDKEKDKDVSSADSECSLPLDELTRYDRILFQELQSSAEFLLTTPSCTHYSRSRFKRSDFHASCSDVFQLGQSTQSEWSDKRAAAIRSAEWETHDGPISVSRSTSQSKDLPGWVQYPKRFLYRFQPKSQRATASTTTACTATKSSRLPCSCC